MFRIISNMLAILRMAKKQTVMLTGTPGKIAQRWQRQRQVPLQMWR
jgi:hypothetical protein